MSSRVARFMGVDISKLVAGWGKIEQIKSVLLAQATLLSSEMSLEVFSSKDFASPFGSTSLLGGLNYYNKLLEIEVDGVAVYVGLVKNVRSNATKGTAVIVSENVIKRPAESVFTLSGAGVNPAQAMLAILRTTLAESQINSDSFDQAASPSLDASASINFDFPSGSNVTVLQAIQKISELSSISVFVYNQKVMARPFLPYQGSGAGLKFDLTEMNVREYGDFQYDTSAFNNRVQVGYPTNSYATLNDIDSQRKNGISREIQFSASDQAVAADLQSATFYGKLYLERASRRRGKMGLVGGKELRDTVIGDRFPVYSSKLGLSGFPVEAIEVHRSLDSDEVELSVVELFEQRGVLA